MLSLVLVALVGLAVAQDESSIYQFSVEDMDGGSVDLGDRYQGKVVLVVNTASLCGYTRSNLKQLQQLYEKYGDDGFEVAAFPSNTFKQEYPERSQIVDFTRGPPYKATFDLFAPVEVNGEATDPLFAFLKSSLPKMGCVKRIGWNFEKFLIGRDGVPVKRFVSAQNPKSFEKDIVAELNKAAPLGDNAAPAE